MFPNSKTLTNGPRRPQRISRRSLLATLGIAASVVLGGPAAARADNPPPGLLAKIQIATQAGTTTLIRAQRMPSLKRAAFRTSYGRWFPSN
jgi:hypothetical protein